MRTQKISARRVFKTQTYSNPSLCRTRQKEKESGESEPSQVQTGPSKTPVVIVLGLLVIIIKPITLADFALVGLVCLAVLMIYDEGCGLRGQGS